MRHETDMPEWAGDIKCIDTRWVQWNEMGAPSPDITSPENECGADVQVHNGPRIVWIGSGLMEFMPVRDGHLYGRARINEVCWREFFGRVRPKLPAHIRTTQGLRKKITSNISYGATPKCAFFFDAGDGERLQLGSFFILAEGGAQQ